MWPVPITEESPILSTCMYVDKQAILVSKIAPTVIVQTVQKRLVQKKLHFCLICGLIQRVGNFSLQLLSISLLFSECLTYHTVRYLGENNGAFSDVTRLIHQSKCGSIKKDSFYHFSILKVLCAILRLQHITTGALCSSFDFTSSSQ